MTVPDLQSLMLPVLRAATEEISSADLRSRLASELRLSEADLAEMPPRSRTTTFTNRIAWAVVHLQAAGLLEKVTKGVYRITDEGRKVLASPPERIDTRFLKRYPDYQQKLRRPRSKPPKPEQIAKRQTPALTLQSALERFLARYPEIRAGKSFGVDEELWGAMEDLKEVLLATAPLRRRSHVRVVWSVGHGEWARVPWVALLDDRETTSTQRGVYGVFLFREDMTGAYLTLNQGVTDLKKQSGAAAGLQLLRERAAALRKRSQASRPEATNLMMALICAPRQA